MNHNGTHYSVYLLSGAQTQHTSSCIVASDVINYFPELPDFSFNNKKTLFKTTLTFELAVYRMLILVLRQMKICEYIVNYVVKIALTYRSLGDSTKNATQLHYGKCRSQ